MTDDERNLADELQRANNSLQLQIKRVDGLLTEIAEHLREGKDPMNVSKRAARGELDDLAELNVQVRKLKEIVKPPHTDAHEIQGDLEERMALLLVPAERPKVAISGWDMTPVPKRSASPADGYEWTSEDLHTVLRAYGYDSLVKTQPNSQSVLGAINELKKQNGEHARLPDKFIAQLDADGDPVIDKATGEIQGRTVNIEDYIRINERPSMRVTKGKK